MPKLFTRSAKRMSLGGAATLLIASSILGILLGFIRVRLINANFPDVGPQSTDAYFAAFKIPDFVYFTVAAGALAVAFMPILSDHAHRGDKKGAWELTSSLLNFLAIIMGVFAVILIIFAKPLLHHIVAPNMDAAQLNNAANIMRLVALNPLLFSLSAVLTTMQQTYGRFFFYAIAPLFYNLSIIASIFIFKENMGIVGLGIGALIGGIIQLLIVMCGLIGMHTTYRPRIIWRSHDFKQIMKQLPSRSVDQGIDYINSIAETRFAKRLGDGFISYYENALTLHNAPIQLIGTAISTAAFPRFTERLSHGRPDLFRKEFLEILRAMIWIAMPVVVLSYFCRGYLARMLFGTGAPEIALIFGYLSFAILFRTMYSIISRYFYAQKDTKTPLFVSLFVIALNIFLAYTLSKPEKYGVAGLAFAQTTVSIVEVIILMLVMFIKEPKLIDRKFWLGIVKILSVTGFSAFVALIMISFFPLQVYDRGITLAGKLIFISTPTIAVHLLISWIFSLEEIKPIIAKLKSFVLRPVNFQ